MASPGGGREGGSVAIGGELGWPFRINSQARSARPARVPRPQSVHRRGLGILLLIELGAGS